MTCTVTDFDKKQVTYQVTGCTANELENRMLLFFSEQKYRLSKEEDNQKIFERGSMLWRVLIGAFHKHFKFSMTTEGSGDTFIVVLHKENSGWTGGVIGMHQNSKEFTRISEAFKDYFNY